MADGSVVIDIVGDATRFNQTLQQVAERTRSRSAAMSSYFKSAGAAISSAGAALLPMSAGILAAGAATVKTGIQMGSFLQQTEIGFTTMLGSARKAKQMMNDLTTFAAKTPFDVQGVMSASKKMLAYGFSAKKIIPMLTAVGDASAGLGLGTEGMDRLTVALGQMNAKGKVSAEEMRQLAEAGVPAWELLAKAIGKSIPEAMKLAEKGAIDSDTGISAIVEGMKKKFGGLMDKQSKTAAGAASNLKDAFTTNLGTAFITPLDSIAPKIQELAEALDPAMKKVGPVVSQLAQKLTPLFDMGTQFLNKIAASSDSEIMSMVSGLAKVATMGPGLMIAGKALSGFGSIIGFAGNATATLESGAGKAVAGIVKGGTKIKNFAEDSRAGFQIISEDLASMSNNGKSTFKNLTSNLGNYAGMMKGTVIPSMSSVKQAGLSSMIGLGKGVGGLVGVAGLAGGALLGLGVMAQMSGQSVSKMGADFANGITGFAQQIPGVVSSITEVLPTVVNSISYAAPLILEAVMSVISNIVGAIPQMMPALLQTTMMLIQTLVNAIPTLIPLIIDAATQLIMGLVTGITQALPILMAALPGVINSLVEALITNLPILINGIIMLVAVLATSLIAALPTLLSGVITLITGIVDMLPTLIPTLLAAVTQVLMALVTALPTLIPILLAGILNIVTSLLNLLPQIIPVLINSVISIITALVNMLPTLIPMVLNAAIQLFMAIVNALPVILPALLRAVPTLIFAVIRLLPTLIPTLLNAAKTLFMAIVKAVPLIVSSLGTALKNLVSTASKTMSRQATTAFGEVGRNISDGIKRGITNAWNGLVNKLSGLVNLLPAVVKKILGIHSPSRVFAKIGRYVVAGMSQGIISGKKKLAEAASAMAQSITDTDSVKKATDKMRSLVSKGLAHIPKALKKQSTGLKKSLSNAINAAEKQLNSLAKKNEKLTQSISDAKDKLKEMQDYSQNYQGKFSDYAQLSNIENTDKDGYLEILKNRATASKNFANLIDGLRAKGLSEDALTDIVNRGVAEGSTMASALSEASTAEIAQINEYQSQISSIGKSVGDKFTEKFYGIGVNAQQGIINGLLKNQKALEDAATKIANTLTSTIKKRLKIHSPSRVMFKLFDYAGQGALNGLNPYVAKIRSISNDMAFAAGSGVVNTSTSSVINYNTVKQVITAPVASFSEARAGAKAGQRASLGF